MLGVSDRRRRRLTSHIGGVESQSMDLSVDRQHYLGTFLVFGSASLGQRSLSGAQLRRISMSPALLDVRIRDNEGLYLGGYMVRFELI